MAPFRWSVNVLSRVMRCRRRGARGVTRHHAVGHVAHSTTLCCIRVTPGHVTGRFERRASSGRFSGSRPSARQCEDVVCRETPWAPATGTGGRWTREGTHVSYLLRVRLPDRPGSLGALAVALGSVGADILSLDVVERAAGHAIDDLVVDVEPGKLPDTLLTAAEALDGVQVESIRPYAGILDSHRELELIDQVAAAPHDRLQVLVDGAPRVLRVGWATVLGIATHGGYRIVGSPGAPETQLAHTPWMPLEKPVALDHDAEWVPQLWRDMDTMLAAAPLGSSDHVLVLGRPGGPEFRPSEIASIGYFAGIVGSVLG